MTYAIVLAIVLAPYLHLSHTGPREIYRARDLWLLGVMGLALVLALVHARPFAPMALWFLLRWRTHDTLPSVLTWVAIATTWWAVATLPSSARAWLPIAWGTAGAILSVLIIAQRILGTMDGRGDEPYGWLGQRTFASAFLAIVIWFVPHWSLGILLAGGLWLTGSWVALAGLLTGGALYTPWSLAISLPAASCAFLAWRYTRWIEYTPRGNSIDSYWDRWRKWQLTVRHLSWWGAGPNSMDRSIMRWNARYKAVVTMTTAHNEALQHVYEYGLLGACAVLVLGVDVGLRLRVGDPWGAAAVTAAVICLGTFPLRIAPIGVTILAIWAGVGR